MKKLIKPFFLGLVTALAVPMIFTYSNGFSKAKASGETGKSVDVVFMHDTHSHLNSFLTMQDGESAIVGGFAQIKTIINDAKTENPDTLVLDAGDYSMGTLVQTIYDSESAELRMLGELGIDVTTLGNHEFDYRSQGLVGSLTAAKDSGDVIPQMVLSNIDWTTMESEGLTDEQLMLKNAFEYYGMKEYIILNKGDVKIAVFGIFGEDSLSCAPTCVLKFRNASEAAAETVSKIKATEDVDMIVCISHSGTNENESKSEDEILAKNVPDIDLIISAHTHTILNNYIRHDNTYIGSCGEYGKNVGTLSMQQSDNGRWEVTDYELVPITPSITSDAATQDKVNQFMEIVDSSYLAQFGYSRNQILAQNDVVFSTSPDLYDIHTEHNLGDILSDAFLYTVSNTDTGDNHPVDLAIVPSGCVRDTFAIGDITVEDVFNAYSLGIGLDGVAGYPLISVYLTGAELKMTAEIDASMSDIMTSARLYMSGLNFDFNTHRVILNKVTDCYLVDTDNNRVELEDDKLYRVVCDLYSGQMLGAVNSVSYGILSLEPKFADGTPIQDIEDAIIHTADGKEIKAWAAIAGYLEQLADTDNDGIANIPASYSTLHGRKALDTSWNPINLIQNPNKFGVIIVLIVLVLIVLLVLIICLIVKWIKKLIKKPNGKKNKSNN